MDLWHAKEIFRGVINFRNCKHKSCFKKNCSCICFTSCISPKKSKITLQDISEAMQAVLNYLNKLGEDNKDYRSM